MSRRSLLFAAILLALTVDTHLHAADPPRNLFSTKSLRKFWPGRPYTDVVRLFDEPTLVLPGDEDSGPTVFYVLPYKSVLGLGPTVTEDPHTYDYLIFNATEDTYIQQWNRLVDDTRITTRGAVVSHEIFAWALDPQQRVYSARRVDNFYDICDTLKTLQELAHLSATIKAIQGQPSEISQFKRKHCFKD